ncbi:thiamine kinase-like enzyme [Bradyrhizobium sp. USDA 4369]
MQLFNDSQMRAEAAADVIGGRIGTPLTLSRLLPSIAVPLHLALDAAPYLVSKASGEPVGFLKVYELETAPFVDWASVVAGSRRMAELQLGPALLDCSEEQGALLYEWLSPAEWRMARRENCDRESTLVAILAAKRTLHRSEPVPVTRSPFDVIRHYLEMMRSINSPGGGVLNDDRAVRELGPWIERIAAGLAGAGCDPGPIHGEGALSNVMLNDGGGVRLVDCDRVVNADPHYDLASLCLELCSFDTEVEHVVALYEGKANLQSSARVRLYMVVDDFLWGCWSLIKHCTSPRSSSVEFYKYAQNRFLRCRYWLSRWDTAALLRQM